MQVFENQKIVQTLSQYSGWSYPKIEKKTNNIIDRKKICTFLEYSGQKRLWIQNSFKGFRGKFWVQLKT